jgi:hypothetical protein
LRKLIFVSVGTDLITIASLDFVIIVILGELAYGKFHRFFLTFFQPLTQVLPLPDQGGHDSVEKLVLNVDKTNFVIFERRRDVLLSDQYVVRYGNEIVRRVDSVKYLGLHLDSKISFSGQISHIRKKILPVIFALRRSRPLITHSTAMTVYYAYVFFSQLSYLNPIC